MELEGEYYKQALKAYNEKDYKFCLVLLKKLSLNDQKHVTLLVNCTYDLWESNVSSSRLISTSGKTRGIVVENSEVLNVVTESFQSLLSKGTQIPITAYDYLRLTRIYLSEGSLEGALKVLQLASARGYLEHPLIILQTWSILTRAGPLKESNGNMNYLVSQFELDTSRRKRAVERRIRASSPGRRSSASPSRTAGTSPTRRLGTAGSTLMAMSGSPSRISPNRRLGAAFAAATAAASTRSSNSRVSSRAGSPDKRVSMIEAGRVGSPGSRSGTPLGGYSRAGTPGGWGGNGGGALINTSRAGTPGGYNSSRAGTPGGYGIRAAVVSRGGGINTSSSMQSSLAAAVGGTGSGLGTPSLAVQKLYEQWERPQSKQGATGVAVGVWGGTGGGSGAFYNSAWTVGAFSFDEEEAWGDCEGLTTRGGADSDLPVASMEFLSDCPDMPLWFAYLHCAAYLRQKASSFTVREKAEQQKAYAQFNAILSEAYYLQTSDTLETLPELVHWFRQPGIWEEMGDAIEPTPFVLLALDSYWHAFVRDSLAERPLRKLIALMEKYHMGGDIPTMLGKVMNVNPWNLFGRACILEWEEKLVDDPEQRQWAELFQSHHRNAITVQACVRSWQLRLRWHDIKHRLLIVKNAYQALESAAVKKGQLFWFKYQIELFGRWLEYVEEWKALKYNSVTKIIANYRRWVAVYYYQWALYRQAYANSNYLIAAQLHHDFKRIAIFRAWHELYMERLRHRSSDIIVQALYNSGYSKILKTGMDFILGAIKIKRKYVYRRLLTHWREQYIVRLKRRSRVTIRFFVRNTVTRVQQREAEEKLRQLEAQVVVKTEVDFQKNYTPLIREMWDKWHAEYYKIWLHKLKIRLSINLTRMHFRKVGRGLLRDVRSRQEGQIAFVKRAWHLKVGGIFFPWRLHAAAQKIQRFGRVLNAKRVYERLRFLDYEAHVRFVRKQHIFLARMLWRWNKYIYLYNRERIRASYKIVLLFRIRQRRNRLRRVCKRKIGASKMIDALHSGHFRSVLRRLRDGTVMANNIAIMHRFFNTARIGALRVGFFYWVRLITQQRCMRRLEYYQVQRPIEQRYWVGATCSISIRSLAEAAGILYRRDSSIYGSTYSLGFLLSDKSTHFSPVVAHVPSDSTTYAAKGAHMPNRPASYSGREFRFSDIMRVQDDQYPLAARFKPWEVHVPTRPALLNTQQLHTLRPFKAWMAAFRLRQRYLRGSSELRASAYMQKLVETVAYRHVDARRIQRWVRGCLARNSTSAAGSSATAAAVLLRQARIHHELHVKLAHMSRRRTWRVMRFLAISRRGARGTLQCAFRCSLAVVASKQRKAERQRIVQAEHRVACSRVQRSLARKYFHQMQLEYCRSVHRRLRRAAAGSSIGAGGEGDGEGRGIVNFHSQFFGAGIPLAGSTTGGGRHMRGDGKAKRRHQHPQRSRSMIVSSSSSTSQLDLLAEQRQHYYEQNDDDDDDDDDGQLTGGDLAEGGEHAGNDGDGGAEEDEEDEFMTKNERLMREYELARKKREEKEARLKARAEAKKIAASRTAPYAVETASTKLHRCPIGNQKDQNRQRKRTTATLVAKRKLFDAEVMQNPSFQSEECHAHLLRLDRSGVFIYDTRAHRLTKQELQFCLEHATEAVFCQHVQKLALRNILAHFSGRKVVLCGGSLSLGTAAEVLAEIIAFKPSPTVDARIDSSSDRGSSLDAAHAAGAVGAAGAAGAFKIALHFAAVRMGNTARLAVMHSILGLCRPTSAPTARTSPTTAITTAAADATAHAGANALSTSTALSSSSSGQRPMQAQLHTPIGFSNIRELSIDSDSIGTLNIAVLLRALESNQTLEVLVVKCSSSSEGGGVDNDASLEGSTSYSGSTREQDPGPQVDGRDITNGQSGDVKYSENVLTQSSLTHTHDGSELLPCFGESLRVLSRNSHLKELRLFGAPVSPLVLGDLVEAVQEGGFRSLSSLELVCDAVRCGAVAEQLVNAAKHRAYAASMIGLSVTVHYN